MDEMHFVLHGDIVFCTSEGVFSSVEGGYVVCVDGKSAGVFENLPDQYKGLPFYDFSGKVIIPGLVDLHSHAPQYTYRCLGMDMELLPWLETYTFPEEARYSDCGYARAAYTYFADELRAGATTRACLFATAHTDATLVLMDMIEAGGVRAFVGRVNMDRNCPDSLRERSAAYSLEETARWLDMCGERGYKRCAPILTPRFIPSCTDELLKGLSVIMKERDLAVQSHLSENQAEGSLVRSLCPDAAFYGAAYDRFGLFGGDGRRAVMAHCVYCSEEETDLIEERGVYIAHCAQSNTNIASGIAPVRKYIDRKLNVGLGTDVAGGAHLSMFRALTDAVAVSKLYWRLVDQECRPLSFAEAFYLATAGGGAFFGKVGSFEAGYELDALALDDSSLRSFRPFSAAERLERIAYHLEDRAVSAKFVAGRRLF